jgi:hypothetical protein
LVQALLNTWTAPPHHNPSDGRTAEMIEIYYNFCCKAAQLLVLCSSIYKVNALKHLKSSDILCKKWKHVKEKSLKITIPKMETMKKDKEIKSLHPEQIRVDVCSIFGF